MRSLSDIQARLTRCYFSQPERQMELQPGQILREEFAFNDRLYFVLEGELEGMIRNAVSDDDDSDEQLTMFIAKPGAYIGMHSFFSHEKKASSRIMAKTWSRLAWIDDKTAAVEPEIYGSIGEQFMRVIIDELFSRQLSLWKLTIERERVLKQLFESERLSTLGQLASGIAHELNNAISVVDSSAQRLNEFVSTSLSRHEPALYSWFERGSQQGQRFSSVDVRKRYKELMVQHHLSEQEARTLARAVGNDPVETIPANLSQALVLWETGRDFYDMRLAARHASNIVRSVKQLGRNDSGNYRIVDINQTVSEALTLLQSQLRRIKVTLQLSESPTLWGGPSELVQIWVNIIKNACDALTSAATVDPQVTITSQIRKRAFHIAIANNGPQIADELKHKIFQPNFTTKKDEQCIGLGLGLYIVQRLVSGYGGKIKLESNEAQTVFRIALPLTTEPTFSQAGD
ncbi:MAG: ATP-binding protein [Acinetobacter sp.]